MWQFWPALLCKKWESKESIEEGCIKRAAHKSDENFCDEVLRQSEAVELDSVIMEAEMSGGSSSVQFSVPQYNPVEVQVKLFGGK